MTGVPLTFEQRVFKARFLLKKGWSLGDAARAVDMTKRGLDLYLWYRLGGLKI